MLNLDNSDGHPSRRARSASQQEAPISRQKPRPAPRLRPSDRRKHKHSRRRTQGESPEERGRRHTSKQAKQEILKHVRHHKKISSISSISSSGMSAAQLILDQARESIQRDPGSKPHGRKPLVMDVILDSLTPPTKFREDILMEALERSALPSPRWTYTFKDKNSLDAYWADQEAIWKGAHHGDYLPSRPPTQSKLSAERSTAGWTCPSDCSSDNGCNST
ncbi:hypothetical protein NEOLEDRAFT_1179268 [Neolentinus lepideus HHB14362 ss-1]|uniref:Uncharacterized protein n=1 Tax=Neolentinus lepideus HHB14362 ss-1 TaxID=1314782 RepID=A0A165S2M0_9AGAM|nr:hypothetical protein NEOLEDRAFT_1179268 [Neolentinus lepideus HHB14362 ss-1]